MKTFAFFLSSTLAFVGCGNSRSENTPVSTPGDGGPNATGDGSAEVPDGAVIPEGGIPDGCNPYTCAKGCCWNGSCIEGTAPAQCGLGGLACVDCTVYNMGCVNHGCAVAKCENCDGCCKAGTCNTNGKTQDDACGKGGDVCIDCTNNNQTCDGNGLCH